MKYDAQAAEIKSELDRMHTDKLSILLSEFADREILKVLEAMNYDLTEIEFYEDWQSEDIYWQQVYMGTTKTIYAYVPKGIYNGEILTDYAAALKFVADNHGINEYFKTPTAENFEVFCCK